MKDPFLASKMENYEFFNKKNMYICLLKFLLKPPKCQQCKIIERMGRLLVLDFRPVKKSTRYNLIDQCLSSSLNSIPIPTPSGDFLTFDSIPIPIPSSIKFSP